MQSKFPGKTGIVGNVGDEQLPKSNHLNFPVAESPLSSHLSVHWRHSDQPIMAQNSDHTASVRGVGTRRARVRHSTSVIISNALPAGYFFPQSGIGSGGLLLVLDSFC